jgi:hypothetical protein
LSTEHTQNPSNGNVVDTAMEVAGLFWDLCSNIVLPKSETKVKGRHHDKKQT